MSIFVVSAAGLERVDFHTYPDGTFYTKWRATENAYTSIVVWGTTVDELHKALYLKDALDIRAIPVEVLVIPFVPGGRQDRVNGEGDFLFTLASVATDINSRGFNKVIVSDAHSPATTELIRNSIDLCFVDFDMFVDKYDGVIAPDKGAALRAEDWSFQLGIPAYYATKVRDVETGALTGFGFPEVGPGRYIVVDDICDGGGTFLGLAAEAPEGVTLDLFVTHGLFTKGTDALTEAFGNLYTTFVYSTDVPDGVTLTPSDRF